MFQLSRFPKANCISNAFIRNKKITSNVVEKYKECFYSNILLNKPNIIKLFQEIGYDTNPIISSNPELMRWFFYINIKARLLKQSMKVIKEGYIKDIQSLGILCNFINDNLYLQNLSNTLLNE